MGVRLETAMREAVHVVATVRGASARGQVAIHAVEQGSELKEAGWVGFPLVQLGHLELSGKPR
jgi:hypothetical protein